MNRDLRVGEIDSLKTRVYFEVRLLGGTPALSEAGGQPQISINGNAFDNTGIGQLTAIGFGSYYAQLNNTTAYSPGDIVSTRYASGLTQESRGDVFRVVDNDFTAANIATLVVDYYGTLSEADQYFATRIPNRYWSTAMPDSKIAAMRMATEAIDRLNIAGLKQEDSQILQFPRRNDYRDNTGLLHQTFSADVPEDIKVATYLCAAMFLGGWDADMEINNLQATMNRIGPSTTQYDRSYALEHTKAGIPSAQAWMLIRPYLRDPNEVTMVRAS